MGSFITISDLEKRCSITLLAQYSNDAGTSVRDDTVIEALIGDAEGDLVGSLHNFTTVQLLASSKVKSIACSMVLVLLQKRKDPSSTDLQSQYDELLKRLERLNDGDEHLDNAEEIEPSVIVMDDEVDDKDYLGGKDFFLGMVD